MDGLTTDDLARILGLFPPWELMSATLDESDKALHVEVIRKQGKPPG